jgi:hypothetical protein
MMRPLVNNAIERRKKVLDGFKLLELSGLALPEELLCVNLNGGEFTEVAADDMSYFTELQSFDASENYLELADFCHFSSLKVLKIPSNNMQTVGYLSKTWFQNLVCLDLSYNNLGYNDFTMLGALPQLKELDFSGNSLKEDHNTSKINSSRSSFAAIQDVVLEYNGIDDSSILLHLIHSPSLVYCSLAHNYLSTLSDSLFQSPDHFRYQILP